MTARGLIELLKRVDPESEVAYTAYGEVYQLKSVELTASGLLLELEPYPFDPLAVVLNDLQRKALDALKAKRRCKGAAAVKNTPASPADLEKPA